MLKLSLSTIILLIGVAQSSAEDRRYPLRLLEHLLAARSPHAQPRRPVPVGRGMNFAESEVQEVADHQYQLNVRLLLAEVQSQLLGSERAHEFFIRATRYGIPSFNNLNFCDNYILSYDIRLRHPSWILEHISNDRPMQEADLGVSGVNPFMSHSDYGQNIFPQDPNPPFGTLTDYQSVDQSHCSSRIIPRFSVLNPSLGRRLESYLEHIARHSRNLYVITGAMYKSVSTVQHLGILDDDDDFERVFHTTFGPNGVAIPTHLFKVVVYEDMNEEKVMEAFLIPNKDKVSQHANLNRYRVHILRELPRIERETGLRFFEILDRMSIRKPHRLYLDYEG